MNRTGNSPCKKTFLAVLVLLAALFVSVDAWLGHVLVPAIQKASTAYNYPVSIKRIDSDLYDGSMILNEVGFVDGSRIRRIRVEWLWGSILSGGIRLKLLRVSTAQMGVDFFHRLAALQGSQPASEPLAALPGVIELLEIRNSELLMQDRQRSAKLGIPWLRIEQKGSLKSPEWLVHGRLKASMDEAERHVDLAALDLDGKFAAVLAKMQLGYAGKLNADGLTLKDKEKLVRLKGFSLNGKLKANLKAKRSAMQAECKGQLKLEGIEASQNDQLLTIESLAVPLDVSLAVKNDKMDWQLAAPDLNGKLSAVGLMLKDKEKLVRLKGFSLNGELKANLRTKRSAMQAEYKGQLKLEGIEASQNDQLLTIESLAVPLDLSLAVKNDKMDWQLAALSLNEPVHLGGKLGDIKLPDTYIQKLSLSSLSSRKPEKAADISLAVAMGSSPEIGRLQATGALTLLHDPVNGTASLDIDLEAAPLSRFAESDFGLSLDSGRLNMHSDVMIEGRNIKANNSLVMNRLRVSKADVGLTARLAQTIGMSPDIALDLLRDSDDRIRLNVPVSLQIKEGQTVLQTDLSSIYAAAMLGAMQKAALSYVKNLFQPYGMAIDALQWVGKESRRMRLSPIFFRTGLAAPVPEAQASMEKMAAFLRQHDKLSVAICAVVTKDEAALLAGRNGWRKLAADRVQRSIEGFLALGVARDQLTLCKDHLEADTKGKPRVEVLL